jgi:signal transduction histidine kinase
MAAALDPAGAGHYRATFRIVRPDGSERWVEGHGQVAFAEIDGMRRPVRLAGLTFDVTERVRTLEALRESESRLDLAMRSANLGVFDWDLGPDTLTWSDATWRTFGLAPGEPRTVAEAMHRVHPDDRAEVDTALAAAFDPFGDGAFRARVRVVRPDGEVRWIDAVGQARFDDGPGAQRRATRLCGVIADVTEAQLALERLRDADRRKDEFLAMLAHELRNPLAPLATAHAVLERGAGLGERERAALDIARRQMRQLGRLVDDLLEVSRITRGKISLRLAPVGVAPAVYEAAEALAPAIESRRQTLEVTMPPRPPRIVGDPARLAQVLENLLANASKFTPDGGTIRVEVEVEDDGDEVAIRVVDTGVGIEPSQLSEIFELFAQADASLDRAQGGLGIGLALVRRLVAMHGGRVWASSAGRGQGATFTVRLPIRGPDGAADAPGR